MTSLSSPPAENSSERVKLTLLVLVPLLFWASFVRKMATDWSTNAQYEFGYFVPLFILYLLGRRWSSRPEASFPNSAAPLAISGSVLLFLLLPLRVIQEANPDWRPLNWFQAILILILTLVAIGLVGGKSWITYFSTPFLLIFFALPWPLAIEQTVLQGLSGIVTTVTVELLNLVNIPALQRGNVIDIAAGSVGIADACSGIRSLAGTLMASFFFGEFYRLVNAKRVLLVFLACLISFVLNLCRAFFLSWRAAAEGIHSIEKWHDPAGLFIFLLSFASLWLLASFIAGQDVPAISSTKSSIKAPKASVACMAFCLFWVMGVEVVSECWYRIHEGKRAKSIAWDLKWPNQGSEFEFNPVSEETRSILRYTSGKSGTFRWTDGTVWQVFFFHWAPGRSSAQLSTMHRPEVCLPAIGYKFISETTPVNIALPFMDLKLTGSLFQSDGGNVYVYRCLWEDFPISALTRNRAFDMSVKGRLLSSWYGRRNLGQRMLQVAMVGFSNEESARQQLGRRLAELIALKG